MGSQQILTWPWAPPSSHSGVWKLSPQPHAGPCEAASCLPRSQEVPEPPPPAEPGSTTHLRKWSCDLPRPGPCCAPGQGLHPSVHYPLPTPGEAQGTLRGLACAQITRWRDGGPRGCAESMPQDGTLHAVTKRPQNASAGLRQRNQEDSARLPLVFKNLLPQSCAASWAPLEPNLVAGSTRPPGHTPRRPQPPQVPPPCTLSRS